MSLPGTSAPGKFLVLIDGRCVLCNRLATFVIRHDPAGQFQFAALSTTAADAALARQGLPPPPTGTFVLVEDSRAYFRSEAALRLMERLGRPWSLLVVFRLIPLPLRDAIYSLVARLRYRVFGQIESCSLLSPKEKARFLF